MTERTKERWPPADTLVRYLQDFAQSQIGAGRVLFGATVTTIAHAQLDDTTQRFPAHNRDFVLALTLAADFNSSASSTTPATLRCGAVVVATGLPAPHIPASVPGIDLAEGYEHQPATGEAYDGLAVAVLGMGNAGLETYDSLSSHAAYVHVLPGRGRKNRAERLSWESRYVGDVRALNAGLLDSYLLKSLDGGVSDGLSVCRGSPTPLHRTQCHRSALYTEPHCAAHYLL